MASENASPSEMAVEESPLSPRRTSRPLIEIREGEIREEEIREGEIREGSLHREPSAGRSEGRTR